jgi:hypothetical protein
MHSGNNAIQVAATRTDGTESSTQYFTGIRDSLRYHGTVLHELSTWSALLVLPMDGVWELRAVASGTDGHALSSKIQAIVVRHGAPAREFRSFTPAHLITVCILFKCAITLGFFAKAGRKTCLGDIDVRQRFIHVVLSITVVMWLNELIYQAYWFTRADGRPRAP